MAERSVVVRIRAELGDFRKNMQEASKVTQEVGKTATETAAKSSTALGQMVQSAQRHEEAWSKSGGALLGFGAAVAIGVGMAIKSYAEFDKAMSEVKAATHASAGDLELLRGAAINAGADTAYSAREAAEAITELSKAGVTTKDILSGGLDGALSLAAAGSLEVADAAELAATAMVQFKLSGDQIPHLADLLAAGAGKAQGSVQDLGAALNQSGLIAASTGLSIEETTGGLAAFASAGLLGSDAGTSFKTMLQSLTPNSKEAEKEMARLGISAYDQQGKFIGLSKFAGVLQDSMRGVSDESRNASMKIIFGSDAVRAANVLYEQGAKGIADWTAKVNDSGYAAATAAIKQDNLAGDIEKLGGSLDSVFLKSGSGANEVLRSLAQSAERVIDVVGGIPGPLLQTGLGLAAVTGGAALVGGAFLTTFPKILETKRAFSELAESSPKLAGGLGKVAKAAGIAAAAVVGLQIVGGIGKTMFGQAAKSTEDYAQALLTIGQGTEDLDAVFRDGGLGTQINGVGDALARMSQKDVFDDLSISIGDFFNSGSKLNTMRDNIQGLDSTLSSISKNGGAGKAGDAFAKIAAEADNSAKAQGRMGMSTADVLKLMPQYTDALKGQATALGVKLEQHELEEMALGKIPARLAAVQASSEGQAKAAEYQAKMTEEATKKLDDMGIGAEGAVLSLSKLLDAMFKTGLVTLSARDAEAAYQETLDGLKVKIDEVKASQSAGNAVLDAATGSFDLTSAAGRGANDVFGELAQKAIATTQAMANNNATQDELGVKLGQTYTSLYDTARAFGASETKADDLARSALSIPKDVPIAVAIQNYADTMAKAQGIKTAIDGIRGKEVDVVVNHINRQADGGGYADDPSMTALAPGSLNRRDGGLINFAKGGQYKGYAMAGYVRGPGTGTSDEINARLSNGEYVIRASKVAQYGVKTFDAYNNGYAAPSKSLTGGYGQAQSFSGYNGQDSALAVAAPVHMGDTYVQNPFTGQYLLAQVDHRASEVLAKADSMSQHMRKGRR
ncbi:phage tail tape measure protein [Pseudarthrobacter sp. SSS035]|uniref:phage tail tape measure protein n=1 Tax=Pseudarthrobacter sp. SSS035 TaxID=2931399 RepID=UPI00200BB34A|nr:phage tail tape measure protein [Pseudarthrobacter sp. SSS035]